MIPGRKPWRPPTVWVFVGSGMRNQELGGSRVGGDVVDAVGGRLRHGRLRMTVQKLQRTVAAYSRPEPALAKCGAPSNI